MLLLKIHNTMHSVITTQSIATVCRGRRGNNEGFGANPEVSSHLHKTNEINDVRLASAHIFVFQRKLYSRERITNCTIHNFVSHDGNNYY